MTIPQAIQQARDEIIRKCQCHHASEDHSILYIMVFFCLLNSCDGITQSQCRDAVREVLAEQAQDAGATVTIDLPPEPMPKEPTP